MKHTNFLDEIHTKQNRRSNKDMGWALVILVVALALVILFSGKKEELEPIPFYGDQIDLLPTYYNPEVDGELLPANVWHSEIK